jgi:hypothetical protein
VWFSVRNARVALTQGARVWMARRKHWHTIHGNADEQYAQQEREEQREKRAAQQQQPALAPAPVLTFRDDSPAPVTIAATARPPVPTVKRQPTDTAVEKQITAAAVKIQAHRRGLLVRWRYAKVGAQRAQAATQLQVCNPTVTPQTVFFCPSFSLRCGLTRVPLCVALGCVARSGRASDSV